MAKIDDKDFIGQTFSQNCGDFLEVLERSSIYTPQRNVLFRCQFKKYPYEVFVTKQKILNGSVNNPQIEQVEFIDKIWPQNCGDSLRIIKKDTKAGFWECEFIKYPYKGIFGKSAILRGNCLNPQIEQIEFFGKLWLQHCGDSLKILKKTDQKLKGNNYLYEVEFVKYPYKKIVSKVEVLRGIVTNPLIENFIGQKFFQNCGDFLKVLYKTNKKEGEEWLYECEFVNYKYRIIATKRRILKGEVCNYKAPPYCKENFIKYIRKVFKDKKPTLKELAESLNLSKTTVGRWINKHELRNYISYYQCYEENGIREWIQQQNNSFSNEEQNFKNEEGNYFGIDIYSANLKFGIEFNGNYWHSNLFKTSQYHQEKSLFVQKQGIKLFHIWEWEWNQHKEIIQSIIQSKLGIFNKKIGASKCKIKELDYKTYAVFCNENHLQGECGAKVKLGLFYKDELIQIMSFGAPRFTYNYQWEILRECSKLGYCIMGGKEKLWKYFIKNYSPSSVISYCDFSKFTGESYLKLGFKKERLNKPGFWWYNHITGEVIWRNPYKHNELKNKEYEKLYDCGQLVFIWNKDLQ